MEARLYSALVDLARSRAGYVASWEADLAGVARRSQAEARRSGLLVPVRRGVARLSAAPVHPREAVHAATLAVPTAVATRASALALRPGLPILSAMRPQIVTVGHLAARCSGLDAHVTRRLDREDVTVVAGTPSETFGWAVLSVIGDPRVHWRLGERLRALGFRSRDDDTPSWTYAVDALRQSAIDLPSELVWSGIGAGAATEGRAVLLGIPRSPDQGS